MSIHNKYPPPDLEQDIVAPLYNLPKFVMQNLVYSNAIKDAALSGDHNNFPIQIKMPPK